MAEVAGLVLGVAGVAGLYSVTLQVFEQISDAAKFDSDFETHKAKLQTAQRSLRVWGSGTGFTPDGSLLPDHHPLFDDDHVLYDVQSALFCIRDASAQLQACFDKSAPTSASTQQGAASPARSRVTKKIVSAGKRLRWAFHEKTKVEDLLNQVICLIGLLYKIARPKEPAALECDAKLAQVLSSSQEQSLKIADGLVNQAKQLQQRKQEDIEKWLDAPRTQLVYHAAVLKALTGTCQWITQDALLQRWIDRSSVSASDSVQCLWLYSRIPGAGKTVAAAKLVEALKARRDSSVAYYFCSHESNTTHGCEGILRSWITQLARFFGWDTVEAAYDISIEEDKPCDPWAIFRSILTAARPAYLILDGLDELEDRSGKYTVSARTGFLRDLLATIQQTSARLLIVSRFELDIDRALPIGNTEDGPTNVIKSEIQLQQTAADIERVARHELLLRFPKWTEQQQNEVVTALIKRADGMFVLLYAILEQLGEGASFLDVIQGISQPLSGHSNTDMLQQAYLNQVQKIVRLPPAGRDFCLSVLLWVQSSERPLRIVELLDVLQVVSRRDGQDLEIPDIRNHHDLEMRLLRHCAILLTVRNDGGQFHDSTLHLAHYSVKEFLHYTGCLEDSQFPQWKLFKGGQLASAYLAKSCLAYLLQSKFSKYPAVQVSESSRGVFEYNEEFGEQLKRHSMFYDYAASFWSSHLDMCCSKPDLVAYIQAGMTTKRVSGAETAGRDTLKEAKQLLEVISPGQAKEYEKFLPLDNELLGLCLDFLGLKGDDRSCCNYKIWRHYNLGVFAPTADDDYLASARNYLDFPVRLFGESWVHKPVWRMFMPSLWQRHLFTTYGPDRRKLRLQSRLLEVLDMQSTALTAILVDQGADINFTWPDNNRTLELYSGSSGRKSSPLFFYVLISHFGASTEHNKPEFPVHIPVNNEVFRAGGGGWFTPRMLWGFLFGNVLQRKVLSAWYFAEGMSDLTSIRMMILFHIEVNNRSLFFPSSVHAAIFNDQAMALERESTLQTLLDNGGDANIGPWLRPIATFGTDTTSVRETLWEMVLQLLPSSGVSHGRTFGSLLRLIENDNRYDFSRQDTVRTLLTDTALRYNSAGWVKQERLQLAVRKRDIAKVRSFLESGVNVNKCGVWYGSALYVASYHGMKDMVELLLEHNADPNIAVETRILPLELERDFEWSGLWRKSLAKDGVRYTPLQAAVCRGHQEIVKLLLDSGADVNRNEGESGTALYFAVLAAKPKYLWNEWNQERTGGDKLEYWRDLNKQSRDSSEALIKLLLDNGAEVNRCGGRYWTPLQAACVNGEELVVLLLLRKGADANIIGGEWGTALQAALVNFPDPEPTPIEQQADNLDPFDYRLPYTVLPYLWILKLVVLMQGDDTETATNKPPTDKGLLLAICLLKSGGADPTLLAGPWGSALHAAAYYSSAGVMYGLLTGLFSDATPTAMRTAANTAGSMMGLAMNGALVTGRWDKVHMLRRYAQAEYHWLPLLSLRLKRIGYHTFGRLGAFLGIFWIWKDLIIVSALFYVVWAISWPIYQGWTELDEKARTWDPQLGALWLLFSWGLAGYVATLRQNWTEDTAW